MKTTSLVLRPWLWVFLSLQFLLAFGSLSGAPVAYREMLKLKWGKVEFIDGGNRVTVDAWYTRTPPTFAVNEVFSLKDRLCLSNSFLVCTGRVGNAVVWRISSSTRQNFSTRAGDDGCVVPGSVTGFSPLPDDWESGSKSREWTFGFRCQVAPPRPEPSLELALLVEDVPAGTAWEIPIAPALANERVRHYADLSPQQAEAVMVNTAWTHLFLVAPPLRSPPSFPAVINKPEFAGFEVPIAFGVRALAEIAATLSAGRHFSEATRAMLERRLSPDTTNAFPGAYRWFPEPDASQKKFPNTYIDRGGIDALIRVGHPTPAGNDLLERVLPERNEWAIRVGPFRRALAPIARVSFIHGRTNDFPVEDLSKLIRNPDKLADWQADLSTLENCLQDALNDRPAGRGDFFWVPDLTDAHARTVRNLERTRFVGAVQASFRSNRFEYGTTYVPIPVTGKIGASYNPDQGFGGSVELSFTGWPRPGDDFSVRGTVAQRALEGALSYKLPYYRSLDRLTRLGLEILGEAGEDDRFRLGSLSRDPFEHRHAAGGIEHEIFHQASGWDWTERDTVLWDAHELKQRNRTAALKDAGVLFRHRQIWRFTPDVADGAKVAFDYSFTPAIAFGPRVGWDKSFWTGEVGGHGRMAFGGEDRAMRVTLRGAFGAASDNLPPALLYRLGDVDRLAGLEPGEFSGLSYVHGELSYDISLSFLLGGLFTNEQGTEDPPPFLAGLALQVLAEIGTFSEAQEFQAATQPDKIVSSYGLALQKMEPGLGGVAFRLGYAWSPDSLRKSGRVFTSLDWSF